MVCECLRSLVESLACTCVLCCDLAKHCIFLAQMLRARMHGALPKVSGGWMLRMSPAMFVVPMGAAGDMSGVAC